jgi:hypothetical protein
MKTFRKLLKEFDTEDIAARDLMKHKKAIQKKDPELYKQLHKDLMSGGAKKVIAFFKKNAKVYLKEGSGTDLDDKIFRLMEQLPEFKKLPMDKQGTIIMKLTRMIKK